MVDIFLSYSRNDMKLMKQVKDHLEWAEFSVWIGEDEVPGELAWEAAVSEAINEAMAFVVILTEDSLNSLWVQWEIGRASKKGMTIYPLMALSEADITIPFSEEVTQPINIYNNRTRGLKELVRLLKEIELGKEPIDTGDIPSWLEGLDGGPPPEFKGEKSIFRLPRPPKWIWLVVVLGLLVGAYFYFQPFQEKVAKIIPLISTNTSIPTNTSVPPTATPMPPTPTPLPVFFVIEQGFGVCREGPAATFKALAEVRYEEQYEIFGQDGQGNYYIAHEAVEFCWIEGFIGAPDGDTSHIEIMEP